MRRADSERQPLPIVAGSRANPLSDAWWCSRQRGTPRQQKCAQTWPICRGSDCSEAVFACPDTGESTAHSKPVTPIDPRRGTRSPDASKDSRSTRIPVAPYPWLTARPWAGAGMTRSGAMSRIFERAREVLGPPPAGNCAGGPLSDSARASFLDNENDFVAWRS